MEGWILVWSCGFYCVRNASSTTTTFGLVHTFALGREQLHYTRWLFSWWEGGFLAFFMVAHKEEGRDGPPLLAFATWVLVGLPHDTTFSLAFLSVARTHKLFGKQDRPDFLLASPNWEEGTIGFF